MRRSVLSCMFLATALAGAPAHAQSADEATDLRTFEDEVAPMSEAELAGERGGLLTPFGEMNFGAVLRTIIDGQVALETHLVWTPTGAVQTVVNNYTNNVVAQVTSQTSQITNAATQTVNTQLANAGVAGATGGTTNLASTPTTTGNLAPPTITPPTVTAPTITAPVITPPTITPPAVPTLSELTSTIVTPPTTQDAPATTLATATPPQIPTVPEMVTALTGGFTPPTPTGAGELVSSFAGGLPTAAENLGAAVGGGMINAVEASSPTTLGQAGPLIAGMPGGDLIGPNLDAIVDAAVGLTVITPTNQATTIADQAKTLTDAPTQFVDNATGGANPFTTATPPAGQSTEEFLAAAGKLGIDLGKIDGANGLVIAGGPGGGGSVVLQSVAGGNLTNTLINTASNQNIRLETEINLVIPNLEQMQQDIIGEQLQMNLNDALGQALARAASL